MWETSRFRSKSNNRPNSTGGNGGGGKRGRGRPRMRMKRTFAKLSVNRGFGKPETEYTCRLVLNDLGPLSVTVFAPQPLELGQEVSLALDNPRPLHVRGKITYSALFELSSRIHSEMRTPYRIQVEFEFLNDGEALAVREYVEQLTREDLAA